LWWRPGADAHRRAPRPGPTKTITAPTQAVTQISTSAPVDPAVSAGEPAALRRTASPSARAPAPSSDASPNATKRCTWRPSGTVTTSPGFRRPPHNTASRWPMEIAASWPWPEAMGCSPPRSSSALMSSCFGGHRVEGLGDLDVVVPMDLRSRVDRQVVALRRRRSQHWGLLDTEHLRRTGPDLDTKDFAVTVAGHAGSHYHRLGHDPASGAGLDVGGVEEHVGEFDVVQRPVPERREGHIELSADPGHLGLADPRCCTQRGDEVIDLAGRDPMDVGLHHHRVEGGIDLTAPIEDGREEAAMAELRNRQVHIPGLRRQQAGPAAERSRLGVDQGLEDHLHALADQVALRVLAG